MAEREYSSTGSPFLARGVEQQFGSDGLSSEYRKGKSQAEDVSINLFGQSMAQTGQQMQDVISARQAALKGEDPASTLIKQSTANQIRAQRMGQGLTTGQETQMRREGNLQSQSALFNTQQANLNAYQSLIGKIAANQQGSIYGLASLAAGQSMPTQQSSGLTVICTQLRAAGYLNDAIWESDQCYGDWVMKNDPYTYIGYRLLADPIVKLMKKSKLFTWVVSIPGRCWARHMYDGKNVIGAAIHFFGTPICRFVGLLSKINGGRYA